jgi:copper chaperone CopZ
MEEKVFKIRGMFGEHCERAIIDALSHFDGVTDIDVNMKNGTISFSYDPALVTLITIKDAITDEGYDLIGA